MLTILTICFEYNRTVDLRNIWRVRIHIFN
jgi:hypothetical protein